MAWMVLEGGRVVEGRWRGAPPPPLPSPPSPPSPPSTRLTAIGLPEDFSSSIVAAMEETQVNTDMAKRAIVDKQLKVRMAYKQTPAVHLHASRTTQAPRKGHCWG